MVTVKRATQTLSKYREDNVLLLKEQIDDLERDLPTRLKVREDLEADITTLTNKKTKLDIDIAALDKKCSSLFHEKNTLSTEVLKLQTLKTEQESLVKELKTKTATLEAVSTDIKKQEQYLLDLNESVRIAESALSVCNVKINSFKEHEESIKTRETKVSGQEQVVAEQLTEAKKLNEDTTKKLVEITERQRIVELGGKTIGHYVRGIQAKLKEKGIEVDILQLISDIK
jgi:chromosome segregation ATPase